MARRYRINDSPQQDGDEVDRWETGDIYERYGRLGGRGWFEGWSDAMHREGGPFSGRGPRNYRRSDIRIEEDINDRLTEHSMLDAIDIEVIVQDGEVTLRGQVDNRLAKLLAEDIAESVVGVDDVINQLKIRKTISEGPRRQGEARKRKPAA